MEGIFFQKEGTKLLSINQNNNNLAFLAGCDSTEIMVQTINPDSLTYITPGDDPSLMEFFYVIDGDITLIFENREEVVKAGESFYVLNLEKEVLIKCNNFVKLLYVTSKPVFNSLCSYLGDLNDLLYQTDVKDKYTYGHGKRVMEYSIKICSKLKLTGNMLENISVSSLFHDVGKCYIPIEILNKNGKLTKEEYVYILKHPVHTRVLLEKHFGSKIAEIAETHHERLDGSGYPYGLCGEDIGLEGRIIAVADTFDAMTTDRPYKLGKSFPDAIEELKDLAEKGLYDKAVVEALEELCQNNEL